MTDHRGLPEQRELPDRPTGDDSEHRCFRYRRNVVPEPQRSVHYTAFADGHAVLAYCGHVCRRDATVGCPEPDEVCPPDAGGLCTECKTAQPRGIKAMSPEAKLAWMLRSIEYHAGDLAHDLPNGRCKLSELLKFSDRMMDIAPHICRYVNRQMETDKSDDAL